MDVTTREQINLFLSAASEIRNMRQQLVVLRAKEEVLNIIAHASGMSRQPTGETVDIAWQLENEAHRLLRSSEPAGGENAGTTETVTSPERT
jgi:hypothetical protein